MSFLLGVLAIVRVAGRALNDVPTISHSTNMVRFLACFLVLWKCFHPVLPFLHGGFRPTSEACLACAFSISSKGKHKNKYIWLTWENPVQGLRSNLFLDNHIIIQHILDHIFHDHRSYASSRQNTIYKFLGPLQSSRSPSCYIQISRGFSNRL